MPFSHEVFFFKMFVKGKTKRYWLESLSQSQVIILLMSTIEKTIDKLPTAKSDLK